MGFMDDILAQQDGGGMVGGLPASWQYQNPDDLTPDQKKMMALVGTQNPDQVGFNPLPAPTAAFPAAGAAPVTGLVNPIGGFNPQPPQAPAAPTFGAGATPSLFVNPPVSTPGNPALPSAPAAPAAADDDEDETPAAAGGANAPASPIAVGNQMMPRVGPMSAFTPDPAALPANAKPTQAAAPAAPDTPGVGDKLMAGFQNWQHGHNLVGSIVAAFTGKRNDPTAVATEQASQVANMTARALIARGVDPQTAIAAVQPGNSEALKELFKTTLANGTHAQETDKDGNVWDVNKQTGQRTIALAAKDDKFQHFVVKNPDGSETPKAFNTKTGEVVDVPGTAAPSGRFAVDENLTGQDRLDALRKADPDYARRIESMVRGDIPLPTGVAALKPNADRMIKDVLAVDGATSASDFATRAATRKDYASGVASRVTKSLNTTIEHASRLDAAIDKLNNNTYFPGVTNWVHDKIGSNTDPEYQKAKSDFESAKEAFVKELDFTLSGGHSSVSGSAELRDKINRADSPEALHAAIQTDLHLLSARLDSHTKGFNEGTKSQRDGQDFLYPKNRAAFNKLMGSNDTSTGGDVPGVSAQPPATNAAPQAPPAPGAYVWTPGGGLAATK